MKRVLKTFTIGAALVAAVGCSQDPTLGESEAALTGDSVIVQWNANAVAAVGTIPGLTPFHGTRAMAAVQLAVFEAVNAVTGGYDAFFGTVTAAEGADAEAAAIVAAHDVLVWLAPAQAGTLDAQRDASLAAISDGQAKTDGMAAGAAAAAAVIAFRTGDGIAPPAFHTPGAAVPYEWQPYGGCPTPGGVTSGALAHWKNVKPYGIPSSSTFRAPPPPSLDSFTYAQDFNEVQLVGGGTAGTNPNRSLDRENVARIYGAQPPHVGWNSTARQILATRADSITDSARTLAMMNMSLSDAHITVFETKYFYRTWRPITAVPQGDNDGNPATTGSAFTPFIGTPCFPGYPSAHGVGSGSAERILEKAYGRFQNVTNSHPSVPGVTLAYSDLRDIISDVSDARVYGGIHFRTDQDAGEEQGREVANYNNAHLLKPRH